MSAGTLVAIGLLAAQPLLSPSAFARDHTECRKLTPQTPSSWACWYEVRKAEVLRCPSDSRAWTACFREIRETTAHEACLTADKLAEGCKRRFDIYSQDRQAQERKQSQAASSVGSALHPAVKLGLPTGWRWRSPGEITGDFEVYQSAWLRGLLGWALHNCPGTIVGDFYERTLRFGRKDQKAADSGALEGDFHAQRATQIASHDAVCRGIIAAFGPNGNVRRGLWAVDTSETPRRPPSSWRHEDFLKYALQKPSEEEWREVSIRRVATLKLPLNWSLSDAQQLKLIELGVQANGPWTVEGHAALDAILYGPGGRFIAQATVRSYAPGARKIRQFEVLKFSSFDLESLDKELRKGL